MKTKKIYIIAFIVTLIAIATIPFFYGKLTSDYLPLEKDKEYSGTITEIRGERNNVFFVLDNTQKYKMEDATNLIYTGKSSILSICAAKGDSIYYNKSKSDTFYVKKTNSDVFKYIPGKIIERDGSVQER